MTNDISTLNGALTELGELMADNLVTMGVTDAQASDGLTTLANRILDIEQGGGCIMIDLETNKSILSYYHTETATLTATVRQDGVLKSGESVQFYINNVAWGSPVTTNASGVATKTYSASGTGDITVKAECRYASETCAIEDCRYWNDGTDLTDVTIGSGVSCTIENDYIRISKSTSGEAYVTFPPQLNNSENYVIEIELAKLGTSQYIAFWLNNATTATGLWLYYDGSKFGGGLTGSGFTKNISYGVGDKFKLINENGVISMYRNNDLIFSKTTSFSSTDYHFGFYTNSGRVQYHKHIKVKAL